MNMYVNKCILPVSDCLTASRDLPSQTARQAFQQTLQTDTSDRHSRHFRTDTAEETLQNRHFQQTLQKLSGSASAP